MFFFVCFWRHPTRELKIPPKGVWRRVGVSDSKILKQRYSWEKKLEDRFNSKIGFSFLFLVAADGTAAPFSPARHELLTAPAVRRRGRS